MYKYFLHVDNKYYRNHIVNNLFIFFLKILPTFRKIVVLHIIPFNLYNV